MITNARLATARTALINAFGREPTITMIATTTVADMYLIFGVAQVGTEFTPFSMRDGFPGLHLWIDDVTDGCRSAIATILDLMTGIAYGNEKNPHA